MVSAAGTKNKKERDLQYKINQIETSLLTLFSGNVRGQIKVNDKIIYMRNSKRNTYEY